MEQKIYTYTEEMQEEVSFDRQIITTVRYSGSARPVIESLLKNLERLDAEMKVLKREHEIEMRLRLPEQKEIPISDEEAERRIVLLIGQFKQNNKGKIDAVDILTKVKIPPEQLERIMIKLEQGGIISPEKT